MVSTWHASISKRTPDSSVNLVWRVNEAMKSSLVPGANVNVCMNDQGDDDCKVKHGAGARGAANDWLRLVEEQWQIRPIFTARHRLETVGEVLGKVVNWLGERRQVQGQWFGKCLWFENRSEPDE